MKIPISKLSGYHPGTALPQCIRDNLHIFKGKVLDLGCGHMPYRELLLSAPDVEEYLGLDLEDNEIYGNNPDILWDGKTIPLDDNSMDSMLSTDVFEHLPDLESVLAEAHRVLKPGGYLFFTVPFLWPLHDVPYDEFRYTPYSLNRIFVACGFEEPVIKAYGGWDASLAQMLALWATLRPLRTYKRKIFKIIFRPFVKLLLKKDRAPDDFRKNHIMVTGFYGYSEKK